MDGSKKLIEGEYADETVAYLANNEWEFTEKIDGTNIRVNWDGYRVSFQGRTDKADVPKPLMEVLVEMFGTKEAEEMFEQLFQRKEVTLLGEGYGEKIQKVGKEYRSGHSFILFDVRVGEYWLGRTAVEEIAKAFNCEVVPIILTGTIMDAVNYIKTFPKSTIGTANMEGVVGRTSTTVLNKHGERVIVKVKCCDFE